MRHEAKRSTFLRNSFEEEVSDGWYKKTSRHSRHSKPELADLARSRRTSGRSNLHRAFSAKAHFSARTHGLAVRVRKNLGGFIHGHKKISASAPQSKNTFRRHQLYGARFWARRLVRPRSALERTPVATPAFRFGRHSSLHRC